MAMDAKDLRIETVERSKDDPSLFSRVGTSAPCGSNKNYQEMSINPLAKTDSHTIRPCAVIGPDRVLPPSTNNDSFIKKGPYEPWAPDNAYRHPPEYPHKMASYPSPIRNISPRQTFQENMQRIMVPPSYNSVINEDFALDRNTLMTKNTKLNGSTEPKYCDVPYTVNTISENQKNTEICVPNSNRNYPPVWHSSVNIRPARPYGAAEMYQYPEYPPCSGSRPAPISRSHHALSDNTGHLYTEPFYQQGNIRYRPYPAVKDRYPQTRYDYINNYPNPFNPSPFQTHKFELQKPPHPPYPQVPIKYLENRMNDPVLDGFQRQSQQINYSLPYQNQLIHPAYGSMIPNNIQNKLYAYPPDNTVKTASSNKVPYDNNKIYIDYENGRHKSYTVSDNLLFNEMSHHHVKGQVIIPNYSAMNMQPLPPHAYYRKSISSKNHEYVSHMRHDHQTLLNTNHVPQLSSEFSPIAISPSESITSNDNLQSQGNLEDCGYISQSSNASIRSIESNVNRMVPSDFQRRFNYQFPHTVRTSPVTKSKLITENNPSAKDKKGINIRQFLQMWNEGDEENASNTKDMIPQMDGNKQQHALKTQEQLYVLGSVPVPSEELGKYDHIQKVSKLPDNIKGCNNIELLKHFEEVIETSNLISHKIPSPRNFQLVKPSPLGSVMPSRPMSPLDVEAKISQSVIHKEVGCNFEIKPCSPQMLNVEVATPVHSLLGERAIEKVTNPYQSPVVNNIPNNGISCDEINQNHKNKSNQISSCKLINTQCIDSSTSHKANYSLHDLESNSGVCLASLPRLDNDIELNFPEVNQQFINANKESVIITKDDPNKETVASDIVITEPEKEFAKLSKYRKNKKEIKETNWVASSQVMRTDSVIIKNPDNTKTSEEIPSSSNNIKNMDRNQNGTSEFNLFDSLGVTAELDISNVEEKVAEVPIEMAIDFSINKISESALSDKVQQDNDKTVGIDPHNTNQKDLISVVEDDTGNSNWDKSDYEKSEYEQTEIFGTAMNSPGLSNSTKPSADLESCSNTVIDKKIPAMCNDDNSIIDYLGKDILEPYERNSHLDVDNNECSTDSLENEEANTAEVSMVNVDHGTSSQQTTYTEKQSPSIESNCEPSIVHDEKDVIVLLKNKIEIDDQDNAVAKNREYDKDLNCNTVGGIDYVLQNLREDEVSSIHSLLKSRRCNLKKKLFSPWIQKLICNFEDTDFMVNKTIENDTKNNNNDLYLNIVTNSRSNIITDNFNNIAEIIPDLPQCDTDNTISTDGKELTVNIYKPEDIHNDLINLEDNGYKKNSNNAENINNELDTNVIMTTSAIDNEPPNPTIDHISNNSEVFEVICQNETSILGKEVPLKVCESVQKRRTLLKRSLSDTALFNISEDTNNENSLWSRKRRKINKFNNICKTNFIPENLNIAQNNRRNSISSIYNEDNVSFCIVIDKNCILTQGNNDEEKIEYAEIDEACLTDIQVSQPHEVNINTDTNIILYPPEENCELSEPFVLEISDEKSFEHSWVDDIGCVETVVTDDISEDYINSPPSPSKRDHSSELEDNGVSEFYRTEKVQYIYDDTIYDNIAELVETSHGTPQFNVDKDQISRESHGYFYKPSKEINFKPNLEISVKETAATVNNTLSDDISETSNKNHTVVNDHVSIQNNIENTSKESSELDLNKTQDDTVNSCESSLDNVFLYNRDGESSSPEVSSTTSEEKNSTILLKITNYKGIRKSQLNDTDAVDINVKGRNSCKFTEKTNYRNHNSSKPRLLITKAAKKYIPPIEEPMEDLKVKLTLPQHRLIKLKQLKISNSGSNSPNTVTKDFSKKQKPKFEDVLKSIDEIQFKMHKERNKKPKKSVPKVVIKKNENGSHYASASNKNHTNPDLTGRKWQPWVFIEKNCFIDKMATKNKTKAIFNHRKNSYVCADNFKKYKSVPNGKFVISHPNLDKSSMGELKYTIRLKHNY